MLLKDEICAGIWKFLKEFEGGGWKFDGGSWKFKGGCWKFEGGSSGGGGKKPLLGGNDSGHFSISKFCTGGPGAVFIRSLASDFFPMSSSLRGEQTIGFSASKVEMSSKANSKGFCLFRIFLLIGSNFCEKLALLILSFAT